MGYVKYIAIGVLVLFLVLVAFQDITKASAITSEKTATPDPTQSSACKSCCGDSCGSCCGSGTCSKGGTGASSCGC